MSRGRDRGRDTHNFLAILMAEYGSDDGIGDPPISRAHRNAVRGVPSKPSKRVDCHKCKHIISPDCDVCGGKGTLRVDSYTEKYDRKPHGLHGTVEQKRLTMRRHDIDHYLEAMNSRVLDASLSRLEYQVYSRERRRESNSHSEVRLAIERLRAARYDDWNRLINRDISNGRLPPPTPENRLAIHWAISKIEGSIRAHPGAWRRYQRLRRNGHGA